jgi:hypothetical protein
VSSAADLLPLADHRAVELPDPSGIEDLVVDPDRLAVEAALDRLEELRKQASGVGIVGKIDMIKKMASVAAVVEDRLRETLGGSARPQV